MKKRRWPITVYELPKRKIEYVIGGDPAGGMSNSTYTAAHVLRVPDTDVVAVVHGKIDPDDFGKLLESLGQEYNRAKICVERNRDGQAINNFLQKRPKNNVFYSRKYQSRGSQVEAKPGLYTSDKNKHYIINNLMDAIKARELTCPHKKTVEELQKFIRKEDGGKLKAQEGFYDDLVMSLAMAVTAHIEQPVTDPEEREEKNETKEVNVNEEPDEWHRNAVDSEGKQRRWAERR